MDEDSITVVPDSTKVKITNLMDCQTGYPTMSGIFRRLAPYASMTVTAEELRQSANLPGVIDLFRNYVRIGNKSLAEEFGVPGDAVEYNWTQKDVDYAITTADIDVLLDALDFAPQGIVEMIVDRAVTLEISDMTKRQAIFEKTGNDITKMIQTKHAYDSVTSDDDKADEKATKRRVQQATDKKPASSNRRRVTAEKKATEE